MQEFFRSDFFYRITGRIGEFEQCVQQETLLQDTDLKSFGISPDTKTVKGIFFESKPNINFDKYEKVVGFEAITEFSDAELLYYNIPYIPIDFSKTLNQLPNLKYVIINTTMDPERFVGSKYIEYISLSNMEKLKLSSLSNVKNLKEIKVNECISFSDLYIENPTVEKLSVYISSKSLRNTYENSFRIHDLAIQVCGGNIKKLYVETEPLPFTRINVEFHDLERYGQETIEVKNNIIDMVEFKNVAYPNIIYDGNGQVKIRELKFLNVKNINPILLLEYYKLNGRMSLDLNSLEKLTIKSYFLDTQLLASLYTFPNLKELTIDTNAIGNLNEISKIKSLERLNLTTRFLRSLDGIEKLTHLDSLTIHNPKPLDVTALKGLPNLKDIHIERNDTVSKF